jgi:integrase
MENTKYQNVYQRSSATRRNHRDGKADICYYIIYRHNGKKVWEKVGWKSEGYSAQMASHVHSERIQAIRHGDILPSKKTETATELTFGGAWEMYDEKWLPNLSRPKDERSRYLNHIAPRFADVALSGIKTIDLEDFKHELLSKGLSPGSTKHVLCLIRCVYNKMVEWERYEGRVPTTGFKMPKVDNARMRYLTPDEAGKLLDVLKQRDITWWRIASISLNTGLRLGEVLALTRNDLDLARGVIHVLDAKAGTRMANMTESIRAMFAAMPGGPPSAPLFPSINGGERRASDVSKIFAKATTALGLNKDVTDRRQRVVFHRQLEEMPLAA